MVDNGYWIECFPVSNTNVGPNIYSATTDAFPQIDATGDSADHAIENIRRKLYSIQTMYRENDMRLPTKHSLSSPTTHHRQEQHWLSIYVTVEDHQ